MKSIYFKEKIKGRRISPSMPPKSPQYLEWEARSKESMERILKNHNTGKLQANHV